MLPTVLCIAPTHDKAETIVGRLKTEGVPPHDISIVAVSHDQRSPVQPVSGFQIMSKDTSKEQGEVVTGAMAAFMASLGALLIPGAQAFMLAPVLISATAAAGTVGATAAATTLSDYELPKQFEDFYLKRLQRGGGYLIMVRTEDEPELARAKHIFQEAGGEDVEQVQFTVKLT